MIDNSVYYLLSGKDNKGANGDSNTNHFNGSKGASVLNSPTNASPVQQVRESEIEEKIEVDTVSERVRDGEKLRIGDKE